MGGPAPVEPNHADRSPEDAEAARITDLYRDDDPDYDEDSYDDEYNNAFGVDETLADAWRATSPPPTSLARRAMRLFPLALAALRARLLSRRSRFFHEDRDA